MWRSTMCERVGDEIRGMDVNPGETAEKWRLVRVQDQLRLKKEQGGELTYARDVKHYMVTGDAEIISIQLNDNRRSFLGASRRIHLNSNLIVAFRDGNRNLDFLSADR
ncbi:hypothetical protein OVA29_15575 [Exiguobacterium sp. SL14]|nr:hypothetical protein [Exiguobacterium sp. SL14]MCY1691890.1 hypothetical protein [Exiguobacterium sp. SL14]